MPGYRFSTILAYNNVHFLNAEDDEIAGLCQNGSLTWAEVSEWMQIIFERSLEDYAPFPCDGDSGNPLVQHGELIDVVENQSVIELGYYILLSRGGTALDIPINREMPRPRALSMSASEPRTSRFRDRVRERDGRCVVTGVTARPPVPAGYAGLHASHIFPVAESDSWKDGRWRQQITDDEINDESGIHSVQNGLLLRMDLHDYFDRYELAINPDNGYMTHCFANRPELDKIPIYRNPNVPQQYQPSRALLKHHFRMCVLLNMKGRAGYPEWDEDIPPGMDAIAEYAASEQGKLRFETVLAGRLNHLIE